MSHLARRSLLLAAGAGLVAAPLSAHAGGGHGLFHHHHGYYSQTTSTVQGLAPVAMTFSAAPMAFAAAPMAFPTFAAAPVAFSAVPAAPMAFSAFTAAPMAFSPATAATAFPSASLSLPAPAMTSALAPAISTAQQQASAAPADLASSAGASYPALAQAAHRARNWDGGRFIVFLRKFIKLAAGSQGSGAIAVLRPILVKLIQAELGVDPTAAGLSGEIEQLLAELNGGEPSTSDNGRCITIRVCIDGGSPRIVRGDEAAPVDAPGTNDGPTPGLSLPSAAPSSQRSPALSQPQAAGSDDRAPAAPPVPAAALPPDEAAKRHDEVMGAIADMGATLKEIRDSLNNRQAAK